MKCLIWLCTFQFLVFLTQGQSIDSLRATLLAAESNGNSKLIAEALSNIAWTFHVNNQNDSALKYYSKSLRSISPGVGLELEGNVKMMMGNIYAGKAKFDSSINYYQAAIKKLILAKDTATILVIESNLSIVFKNVGLYEESLESALHVISSLKSSDQALLRGSCYNTIGALYTHNRDYEKSLEYYRLALQNRIINKQTADVARIRNNIGEVFTLMRLYDSAITNLSKAAEIKQQLNDTKGLARTLNNIGKVAMLTNNSKLATQHFDHALDIQKKIDDPVGMIELLNNMGELDLITEQLSRASANLKKSESIIRQAGRPDYLRQNLELQIRLDREQHDFAGGMNHLEQLISIRDSLFNEEKNRSLQAMQIRYETLKKEQQIAMLEQREENNRNRIRANQMMIGTLGVGLVLFAGIGLVAFVNFRSARAAKQRFELLLADTRHRTKNNLQTLASIFHLQARHYTDHNMILEAKSSESRVHAMSLLHEKFYSISPGQSIELRKYITDLVNQLADIYGFVSRKLSLNIDVDDINLDIDKALPLSLIVQELVSNSFKYAFERISDPQLEVSMKLQTGGDLITLVRDNGIGMGAGKTEPSQGFSLVEAFVDQLHGTMDVKTENGTTFIIRFPTTPLWTRRAS